MSRGAALTGALLVTLASPATWPMALAAFLLRGGLFVVALPILVLPTPVGLGNVLAPTLTAFVFGGVSASLLILVAAIVLSVVAWVIAGGLLAAILESEVARIVAAHEEVASPAGIRPRQAADDLPEALTQHVDGLRRAEAGRVFMTRLLAHLPLGVALAWGSVRLVEVTYHELTNPVDVATPLAWRVLLASPEVVAAIVLTWMVGQALGAMAVRRVVLARGNVVRALRDALLTMLRRPLVVLVDFWLPTVALGLALAPSAVAASAAGNIVREAMNTPDDPIALVLAVVLFVSLWVVGLALAGVICAWRAAVWTVGFGGPPR